MTLRYRVLQCSRAWSNEHQDFLWVWATRSLRVLWPEGDEFSYPPPKPRNKTFLIDMRIDAAGLRRHRTLEMPAAAISSRSTSTCYSRSGLGSVLPLLGAKSPLVSLHLDETEARPHVDRNGLAQKFGCTTRFYRVQSPRVLETNCLRHRGEDLHFSLSAL